MERYRCEDCGYVFDPQAGDTTNDVPTQTSFDELLDGWVCPGCGAAKIQLQRVE